MAYIIVFWVFLNDTFSYEVWGMQANFEKRRLIENVRKGLKLSARQPSCTLTMGGPRPSHGLPSRGDKSGEMTKDWTIKGRKQKAASETDIRHGIQYLHLRRF